MKPGRTDITPRAGLTLVAEAAHAFGLVGLAAEHLNLRKRDRGYTDGEKLESLVMLIAAGGDCVEDIRILSTDTGLQAMFEQKYPSPDALLRFLVSFEDDSNAEGGARGDARLRPESDALKALAQINTAMVRRSCEKLTEATLDVDATVIESHKRDALPHYMGGRGYQPVVAVWAEQDLVVADEFRDGNVPAGMDPLECVRRGFEALPSSVTRRLMRGDTACYELHLLKYLVAEKIDFTIGADMTQQLRHVCEATTHWELLEERARETVEAADVEFTVGEWPKDAAPLRYVAVRFTAKQGELFGDGSSVRYLAVVSNRTDMGAAELLRWHWKKAGTIEQTHDVMKNELAAGTMPSGRFAANAAWFRINALTYNLLSLLRRHALPERLRRAYPKRLRFELFTVGARVTTHAGQPTAELSLGEAATAEILAIRRKLLTIYEAHGAAAS
jgi:Transposase DDE domain group 1